MWCIHDMFWCTDGLYMLKMSYVCLVYMLCVRLVGVIYVQ